MTFFLDDAPTEPRQARNPPRQETGWWEGLGAATTSAGLQDDVNFTTARRRYDLTGDSVNAVIDTLGAENVWNRIRGKNSIPDVDFNAGAEQVMRTAINYRETILGAVADDDLDDIPVTRDQIDQRVNEALQAEYQESQEILAMMPSGRVSAEILGGIVGATADIKNIPFLLMGGGSGSIMRVIGREAAINVAAETAFLPTRFDMAERLNIPDPDIAETLAMAAFAGAGFAAASEGLARGMRYWQGRNRPSEAFALDMTPDVDAAISDLEAQMDAAPARTIQNLRTEEPDVIPSYREENPINPQRPPLILTPDQRVITPDAPDPEIEAQRAALEASADEIEAMGPTRSKPLARYFARRHMAKDAQGLGLESLQIDQNGRAGQDLRARGVTSKTVPGLFKKGGRGDLDNLVASEMEETFPGITAAAGLSDDGMYLDPDGLVEVLSRDALGDSSWLVARAQAAQIRAQAAEIGRTAATDAVNPEVSSGGGLVIDRTMYDFDTPSNEADAAISQDVVSWLDQSGYRELLTDIEVEEIISVAQRDGGDVEFLVERVFEREAEYAKGGGDGPAEEIPFGEGDQRDGRAPVAGEPAPASSRGSQEGAGRLSETPVEYERTGAGEQQIIPGVAPVTERQRLEARQQAPMRGGNAPTDMGLFDTGARRQADMFQPDRDLFSEPTDPGNLDSRQASLQSDAAADDFDVRIERPDGTVVNVRASEAMQELSDDMEFAGIIDLCGRPT